jgi:hypothetical protein
MSSDVLSSPPPDDSGSDTFSRFRYQARVGFPFILRCATEEAETSLYAEHIEDWCVLEGDGHFRFIQVKSRDPDTGYWKVSDFLDSDGGALRSSYRTYQQVRAKGITDFTVEIHVEGYASPRRKR